MIISSLVYSKILEFIEQYNSYDSEFNDSLFNSFPKINTNTLASILHNHIRKKTILNSRRIKHDIQDIIKIYSRMTEEGKRGVFIFLAQKYGVTPVSIARQVVNFLELEKKDLKKPASSKDLIWDSTLINQSTLAYEVHIASLHDSSYSQIANIVATLNGKEYEIYLQYCLSSKGLSFKTEKELRDLNYTKTPDILLNIPISVDNLIIKWIESKALFGDDTLHEEYLEQQYKHYYRFGPGLVIYWYGFVEGIQSVSKKLLIYDHFPNTITKIC